MLLTYGGYSVSQEQLRQAAYGEAADFSLPPDWEEEREQVPSTTIDSEHTRDRDDGIWLASQQDHHDVRVSISDPGSFFTREMAMARYAAEQVETRYLRTGNIPMLPPRISEYVLSLLDDKMTPAISVNIRLDSELTITDTNLSLDKIYPHRMTHQDVAKLTHGEGHQDEVAAFRRYETFALRLLDQRRSNGAFAYYSPDNRVMLGEEGDVHRGVRHSGEVVVQEFMILANTVMAEYMLRNGIPALYRNHQMRRDIGINEAVAIARSGDEDRIRSLSSFFGRARYGVEAEGHAALAVEAYMHWTSPLRRFADFANHLNLIAHLRNEDMPYSTDDLVRIADRIWDVQSKLHSTRLAGLEEAAEAAIADNLTQNTAEQLLALEDDAFYKVVVLASRTGMIPIALQEAVMQRPLKSRELTQLLFHAPATEEGEQAAWQTIHRHALSVLQSEPQNAMSVLSTAFQAKHITEPKYVFSGDMESGFRCSVSVQHGDTDRLVQSRPRGSKKEAQREAALALIADIAEIDILFATKQQRSTEVESPHATEQITNPKGRLQEHFQKRAQPFPEYDTVEVWTDGTKHIYETSVSMVVDGETVQHKGQGSSKKAAEVAAAAAAVQALNISATLPSVEQPQPVSDHPISWLQERSQQRSVAHPKYQFEPSGPDHARRFNCTVTVKDDSGELRSFTASGYPSKKEAKTAAARLAVEELQ